MVINTESKRVVQARKVALELLMSDHDGDCRGPCVLNCPAGTDCQLYVKQIAQGDYHGAVATIKEKLPLPASIGRVCPHPCETAGRRKMVEEPISIAFLKAFAGDKDLASENPYKPEIAADTGKSVGVIGGGPAGLTAAFFLRRAGHAVTIYEAMPKLGGMLRYGIPEYRLPKAVLDAEIKAIADMAKHDNVKLRITGYADSATGDAKRNQALSLHRAQVIADQLIKMGVSKANLIVEGKGGVSTLAPASYNRRVIIETM